MPRRLALLAAALALTACGAPLAAGGDTDHVLTVDGSSFNSYQESGGSIHWLTPGPTATSASFAERSQTWDGNGSDNLPCDGDIHWVSTANVLTISGCLTNGTTTTTTSTTTTTTVPTTTTTTTAPPPPPPPTTTTTTSTTTTSTTSTTVPGATTTVPTLKVNFLTPICDGDVPYLTYSASFGNATTVQRITFINPNGPDVSYTNLPLSGRVLWPGAVIDANGEPLDWPGWTQLADGTWVEGDAFDWVRPSVTVELEINPTTSATVDYPPSSPQCLTNPPPGSATTTTQPRAVVTTTTTSPPLPITE